jgi:hypothetical protein
MRTIPWCLLAAQLSAGLAYAQTPNDLQVRLGAYTSNTDGGEKPVGIWRSTGPVVIGKPVMSTFSVGDACDAFSVSSGGSLRDGATAAWQIEVTPTRVVGDAVTFRLRWQMVVNQMHGNRLSLEFSDDAPRSGDVELTLRPGESWLVYALRNIRGFSCGGSSSIRVSVDHYPREEDERRLIVADLWLVERLPNGSEVQRSQPISVRGLPNRPTSFYFDSIVDANATLDIYGTLVFRPESGVIAISVETRSRWAPGSRNFSGPQRSVKSNIQVKPAETVEIRLPTLGDDAGPFARRACSIRIRARQLR